MIAMSLPDGFCPKLRPLDVRQAMHQGQQVLVLRDPLGISEQTAIVPQSLAPILLLCDGTRELSALRASLAVRYGTVLSDEALRQIVESLDEALLLESERFARARAEQIEAFRRAPSRAPALAPDVYPDDPAALAALLDGWLEQAGEEADAGAVRGLVSPHIDYERGAAVYARTWSRAAQAVREAELVIVLGTDHHGGPGRVTLTPQSYATPLGILPTAGDVVEAVADAVGADAVYAEELHHREEHSIELAIVWLHHLRGGAPCPLVPILCGSFIHATAPEAMAQQAAPGAGQLPPHPAEDGRLAALVEALTAVMAERRTLVVASADLSHVGPAFGGRPLDVAARALLRQADEGILAQMRRGDAEGFMNAVGDDRNNVCGLPPIYLALRLLAAAGAPAEGELVAYETTPADAANTSAVSICGLLWR
jgi:MEMO1 family protein